MSEDVMLQEAIDAIHQGQRLRARDLLTRLLRSDQSNPEYWLWMSSVVETLKEQVFCLQNALRLDPDNQTARKGLILLGALPPEEQVTPVPPARRKWEVEMQEVTELTGLRALWANPVVRVLSRCAGAVFLRGDRVRVRRHGLRRLCRYERKACAGSSRSHQDARPLAYLYIYTYANQLDAHPTHRYPPLQGASASVELARRHLYPYPVVRQHPSRCQRSLQHRPARA